MERKKITRIIIGMILKQEDTNCMNVCMYAYMYVCIMCVYVFVSNLYTVYSCRPIDN